LKEKEERICVLNTELLGLQDDYKEIKTNVDLVAKDKI